MVLIFVGVAGAVRAGLPLQAWRVEEKIPTLPSMTRNNAKFRPRPEHPLRQSLPWADPIMLRVGNFDPALGILPLPQNLRG